MKGPDRQRYGWSDFSKRQKLLTVLVLGLVILMSTAHSLGIDTGDAKRGDDLISGLLGRGDVKSIVWLWIARISMVGIVITVILMRKEERKMARDRNDRINEKTESA